ncbi:MAG: GNAT family N-acetyltransferase [Anaerofustis sp.]
MIRKIQQSDRAEYLEMAQKMYDTDTVCNPVPFDHFEKTFLELQHSDCYASCYVYEEENKHLSGYTLLSKTYSQEAGGIVLWIEELFIKDEFRGLGHAKELIEFILHSAHGDSTIRRIRLEVTESNHKAISLYEKYNFKFLNYKQMILEEK